MGHSFSNQTLFDIIAEDSQLLDKLIYDEMDSDVVLVRQIAHYIVQSGGKRLRPKVLLFIAKALDYQGDKHITLAAIIEFIHIATLLHDDVVDQSDVRRGQPSAHIEFSSSAAILVGDFLYSRAFQLMTQVDNTEVFKVLADTTNRIAEGEVMQLMHIGDASLSEERYFDIIERKTACLFESACWLGAVIAGANEEQVESSKQYGYALGMAFQMMDDILDYTADQENIGKSLGDDLKEGKMTLPLILLLKQVNNDADKRFITEAIEQSSDENLLTIVQMIKTHDVTKLLQDEVKKHISQACNACAKMPSNKYTKALEMLALETSVRNH